MKRTKNKLITIIVFGVAAAAFLVGSVGVVSFRSVVDENNHEMMLNLCRENKEVINNRLGIIKVQVNTLAEYYRDQIPSSGDLYSESFRNDYTERTEEIGYSIIKNNKSVAAVYFRFNKDIAGPKEGFFISRASISSEPEYLEPTDLSMYDRENTDAAGWYYIPMEKGEPVWIGPYNNPNNGIYTLSYVIPVYVDGTFVGVVGMDIDYGIISKDIDAIKLYNSGYAVVLNEAGELSYAGVHSHDVSKELAATVTEAEDEYVFSSCSINYMEYITVSSRLSNGDYLVMLAPENEVHSARNKLEFTIILIAIAVCSLIILTITGVVNLVLRNSHIDNLTGAENRNAYIERVFSLEDAIHSGRAVYYAVLVFDINRLKSVNDNIGHAAGDKMIRSSYELIKKHFSSEKIYRIGGDEFAVLIEKKTCEIALKLAEEFRQEMSERSCELEKLPDEPVISCGCAVYDPINDASFEDTFSRADENMYKDKENFYSSNPWMRRRV